MKRLIKAAAFTLAGMAWAAAATAGDGAPHQRTAFDNGSAGWLYQREVPGIMWVDDSVGNQAPAIHHTQSFAQGSMMFQHRERWLQPLRSGLPVKFKLDTNALTVNYLGSPTARELVLELRDYDKPPKGHPYTSVWTIIGSLDAVNLPGWRTWSVTIADPASATLPAGWGGYGAENKLGEPRLPRGRTFADVLAGVDEIAITTFQPGYAYGSDHDFDVVYDNIEVRVLGQ